MRIAPVGADRAPARYGHPIKPSRRWVVVVALLSVFGCTKRSGDLAAPQRVDDALAATTTTPTFAGPPVTGVTTTTAASTSAASTTTATAASGTTAAPTMPAPASATTRTTARGPTTSVIVLPPSTQVSPANLRLDVAQGSASCPPLQLAFVAVWSIGNAAPGSGLLAFDNGAPRPVPDSGREDRCVAAGTHTYTYSGAVPGGRATRTATFSWS